jgi:hypothetical protein
VVLILGASEIRSMIGPKEALSIATEFFRTFDERDYRIRRSRGGRSTWWPSSWSGTGGPASRG